MSGYIEIVRPEETFEFPVADKAALTLRVIDDGTEKSLRKAATGKPVFEHGQRHTPFDSHKFVSSMIDYAIVGWTGIRSGGADLPCTLEYKLLLPERIKSEVIRLALGKDAGETRAEVAAEKKP